MRVEVRNCPASPENCWEEANEAADELDLNLIQKPIIRSVITIIPPRLENPTMAPPEEPLADQIADGYSEAAQEAVQNPDHRQPKRFIAERLLIDQTWCSIKTTPLRGNETAGFIPTHWFAVNSRYFKEFQNLRRPNFRNTIQLRMSSSDGAYVQVELLQSGVIYVNRFGQRAKIRSATEDPNGPYGEQRTILPVARAPGPQGPKPKYLFLKGIKTEDLDTECPYWAKLMEGLIYPEKGAIPFPRKSTVDHANCLIYIEDNGRVSVQRCGYHVQILPPF